ncbi:hypothetical protein BGZ65_005554 [Modicella reniformis]|uniref:Uncharacterized protein n=1 Tax=Modicella reniformis TaxID=1440133 RepID=A0A9P6IKF3_9FUNG|nr:hypothetical protein BGZ65_005554 [Modicella reniformis]
MSIRHNGLYDHVIKYINNNPGLRLLGEVYYLQLETAYADAFSNLRRLNHLQIQLKDQNYQEYHRRLLEPVSTTLTSLRLVRLNGPLGLRGLVFPNLKRLEPVLCDPQGLQDLLQGCPNLEDFIGMGDSNPECTINLMNGLKSGACPTLKNLEFNVYHDQMEDFAEMLENRSGLQMLKLGVVSVNARFANAINHHASSLTCLSIRKLGSGLILPFILTIVGSCGQLKDVTVEAVKNEAIDLLMSRDNWENPDALESLALRGKPISLRGNDVDMSTRETIIIGIDEPLEPLIDGWKRSRGTKLDRQSREYLTALFQIAQGYSRLQTITINDVVYHKVSAQ